MCACARACVCVEGGAGWRSKGWEERGSERSGSLVVQVVKVGKFLFGQSDGRATCVMEGEVTGE